MRWCCWDGVVGRALFGSDLGASGRVPHVDAFGGPGFLWLGRKLSPKIANVHRAEASKPLTQWLFVQSEAYSACPLQNPGGSAKFLGTLLGSLVSGDPTIWGCLFGSLIFGHPHLITPVQVKQLPQGERKVPAKANLWSRAS